MGVRTADLVDNHKAALVVGLVLHDYGGVRAFHGPVATLRAQSSGPVRRYLEQPGHGRILVVDSLGATDAVLGARSARLAYENGWRGIVVNGFVRDVADLRAIGVGLRALGTSPAKAVGDQSEPDATLEISGVTIAPGAHLYVDEDGVLLSKTPLPLPAA